MTKTTTKQDLSPSELEAIFIQVNPAYKNFRLKHDVWARHAWITAKKPLRTLDELMELFNLIAEFHDDKKCKTLMSHGIDRLIWCDLSHLSVSLATGEVEG